MAKYLKDRRYRQKVIKNKKAYDRKKVHMEVYTEVVNGVCPTCEEDTLLVSITREYYRCVTCGTDLEQHVNGKIIYLPSLAGKTLQSQIDKFLKDG